MNTNPETLRQNAAAMIACADGRPIQQKREKEPESEWRELVGHFAGLDNGWEFRPKPEPKVRPWQSPDDVPGPVCWIRNSDKPQRMVIAILKDGIIAWHWNYPEPTLHPWDSTKVLEYSIDRKAWHKCEVTE